MSAPDPDVRVLEAAVFVVSRALDALVGACLDGDGRPQAPSKQELMRARAMLPPRCNHALKSRQTEIATIA